MRRPPYHRPLAAAALCAALLAAAPASASGGHSPPRPRVVLETVRGDIVIELHPEDAPKTVANFTRLVQQGFYDSLTFHRVVPGFVIQGGDPNSRDANPFNDGQGGPGYTLPAEIKARHMKGAVAMARQPDAVNPERASNGSQFYIALQDLPRLDGAYTVFGRVVSGWPAIDSIVALAARTDIARVGNDANPGTLALIRHARLLLAGKPSAARGSTGRSPAAPARADSTGGAAR
jgi:cyclophilin family peptidyl-prolyl cis-trans isomerase